jgi:hypothetical protein
VSGGLSRSPISSLPANQACQIFNAFLLLRNKAPAQGSRLWATDNYFRGASFHFTLAVSSGAGSLDASIDH